MTLHDPSRHEPLTPIAWDEARARATIERIVRETEAAFTPGAGWPIHPLDADGGETRPLWPLYFGACGVMWAMHYLDAVGAARAARRYGGELDQVLAAVSAPLAAKLADVERNDAKSWLPIAASHARFAASR